MSLNFSVLNIYSSHWTVLNYNKTSTKKHYTLKLALIYHIFYAHFNSVYAMPKTKQSTDYVVWSADMSNLLRLANCNSPGETSLLLLLNPRIRSLSNGTISTPRKNWSYLMKQKCLYLDDIKFYSYGIKIDIGEHFHTDQHLLSNK